jgi:hypothetical protein
MLANNLGADRGRDQRSRCSRPPCLATLSPTCSGLGLSRCSGPADRDRSRTTGSSSTRSCIAARRESLGAIFPSGSAPGRAFSTGSTTGLVVGYGARSSRRCSSTSTRRGRSSMPPTFARTKTRRAEKGDPVQRSGPLSRRFFDQAPRPRRHRSPSALRLAHAGPAARVDRRGGAPRACAGQGVHSGRRLRRRPDRRCGSQQGHEARHLLQPHSKEEAPPIQGALPTALSGRSLLS